MSCAFRKGQRVVVHFRQPHWSKVDLPGEVRGLRWARNAQGRVIRAYVVQLDARCKDTGNVLRYVMAGKDLTPTTPTD